MAFAWYIVHTYSGFENKAKLALEDAIQRHGLEDRFGEVLVPTETVVEVKDGQKRTNTRKVYPGYMFVQMELDNETMHCVKSTPKVTGFIGGTRNPPPVPEAEIRRITNQMEEDDDGVARPVVEFERDEEVRIIDGPFASMKGRVDEVNQARGKLRVMVSIFGRTTPVELDFTQVERLS
ncbi:MAG: transcription termination/antitermination protein NusG [Alphaproteobacteria bacterium]|nr:transcription termination/antitermination protein NusG [Alphaproteobacteria bacterium]